VLHRKPKGTVTDEPIAVGAVIAGYRVERILSARDARCTFVEAAAPDGKRLAMRLFARSYGEDAELRRRVLTLGRLRDAIDAPLLRVLGAGEDRGILYVAHSLPRADTLADLLREGPLDPATAMTLLGQVAGGLETAALLGLPVGMLTPQSILVTHGRPRQALVTDFGIPAAREGGCERVGAIEAVDYCSPEAARGAPAEPASSVYSLTCIVVECLTGAPPFPYERPLQTLHAHLVEDPPRVSERRRGLTPALDHVVATGMSKRPEQRFASPQRLLRAVQKAIAVKAPIPVAASARRHVDAAAAAAEAARRPAPVAKPKSPPTRPARPASVSGPPGRRPQTVTRRRRRVALSAAPAAPAAFGLGLVVLASFAGFATGHFTGAEPAARPPAPLHADPTAAKRAADARSVDRAIRYLNAERTTARRKLRGARHPGAQAAHARALADAYRHARGLLPSQGAAAGVLAAPLTNAERAYRRLATAAGRNDSHAFGRAREDVLRRERELERALRHAQRN
jgi:hypothetical protein